MDERQEGRWATVTVVLAALLGALLAYVLVTYEVIHPLAWIYWVVSTLAS